MAGGDPRGRGGAGADVTHPTGFLETEPSIAAVVASMDAATACYCSRTIIQGHRQEIIPVPLPPRPSPPPHAAAPNPLVGPQPCADHVCDVAMDDRACSPACICGLRCVSSLLPSDSSQTSADAVRPLQTAVRPVQNSCQTSADCTSAQPSANPENQCLGAWSSLLFSACRASPNVGVIPACTAQRAPPPPPPPPRPRRGC